MRVGILTFHFAVNYGAVLQAYALQSVLLRRNIDAYLINYDPSVSRCAIKRIVSSLFAPLRYQFLKKKFNGFRKKYLRECPVSFNFDKYIIGSDQVWNTDFFRDRDGNYNRMYFGDYLPQGRIISYAASSGGGRIAQWNPIDNMRRSLYRFEAISVREPEVKDDVEYLGLSATVVPDPCILLGAKGFADMVTNPDNKRHIFSYVLTEAIRCAKEINECAATCDEYEIKISTLTDATQIALVTSLSTKANFIRPNPARWVSLIATSDIVVTDSFHAVVFGLLFHKRMRVVLKPTGTPGNERIINLLQDICDIGVTSDIVSIDEVDWECVDARIEEYRQIGFTFLDKCNL